MKERPISFSTEMVKAILERRKTQTRRIITQEYLLPYIDRRDNYLYVVSRCPYGQIGDRLWVRETWGAYIPEQGVIYKADGATPPAGLKWKSVRFMPCWASRITLEITGIRIERLQNISKEDAIAEGMLSEGTQLSDLIHSADDPIEQFAQLWDFLNAKQGYPWSKNPFVWVISFNWLEEVKGW